MCVILFSCLSVYFLHCFFITSVMDLRTVVTISTLLLMTVESAHTSTDSPNNTTTNSSSSSSSSNSRSNCFCPSATPKVTATPTTSSCAPALGLITIIWKKKCEGDVHLNLYHPSIRSSPVCHSSKTNVQSILKNVCESKKGCKDTLRWVEGSDTPNGYHMTESGGEEGTSCKTLRVQCTVLPDVQGQLQGYKVVTALLCCVLVVLFLMRFTRPTLKALQKRLSDRRQNRWIGPTQSHSVSYHRGKTAVKNNDGEKRLSYPALERLTVSDSREPSSNRNSGYNF